MVPTTGQKCGRDRQLLLDYRDDGAQLVHLILRLLDRLKRLLLLLWVHFFLPSGQMVFHSLPHFYRKSSQEFMPRLNS